LRAARKEGELVVTDISEHAPADFTPENIRELIACLEVEHIDFCDRAGYNPTRTITHFSKAANALHQLSHERARVDKLEAEFWWMFEVNPTFKDGLATVICTEEQWRDAKAALAAPTIPKERHDADAHLDNLAIEIVQLLRRRWNVRNTSSHDNDAVKAKLKGEESKDGTLWWWSWAGG
jgi:hypothetical protein